MHRLLNLEIIEGQKHIGEPGLSLFQSDRKAEMEFAQVEIPATGRVCAGSTEELNEEGCERVDRTSLEGWWIERTQNRIVLNVSIKGSCKSSAGVHSAKRMI